VPQILAIELEQVEGVQQHMAASRFAPEVLKHGEPVGIAGDRLAIDQAGTHLEPVHGLEDQRIALRPVVSVAGE
jgi:hypothetical protein